MVQRVSQHRLEEESRNRFGLLIPKEWTFRDKKRDYGIDGEVEIFKKDDKATGLIFLVQLKATNKNSKKSIRIEIDKINYFKSLELPVMVVHFNKKLNKFYYIWDHEIDLFWAKKGARSFTINNLKEWSRETPDKLLVELHKRQYIKSGRLRFPIKVKVIVKEDEIRCVSAPEILTKLANYLNEWSWGISLTNDCDAMMACVSLSSKDLEISLAGLRNCIIHGIEKRNEENFISDISKDIILGLSAVLYHAGYKELCAQLIFEGKVELRLLAYDGLSIHILPGLLGGNYFGKIINVAEKIINGDKYNSLDIAILSAILFIKDSFAQDRKIKVEEYLKLRINKCIESGNSSGVGTGYYNLGNHLRGYNLRAAFYCYNKARKYDNNYLERDYFLRELGGLLFLLERYLKSANVYGKALQLGASDDIKPLYADAKMYAGYYKESKDIFDEYINKNSKAPAEWRLKSYCLGRVMEKMAIFEQKRNSTAAAAFADTNKHHGNTSLIDFLRNAFSYDLLCGCAWFNIGIEFNKQNMDRDASLAFIMSGLIEMSDIEAWANAVICSLNSLKNDQNQISEKKRIINDNSKKMTDEIMLLIIFIIETAYYHNQDNFLEALYVKLREKMDTKFVIHFNELVEKILPPKNKTDKDDVQIRLIREDGEYIKILESTNEQIQSFIEEK